MHDPWETWRHTTGVPTHAAVTDGPTPSHQTSHTSLHTCAFCNILSVAYAIMESRMHTQPQRKRGRRSGGLCGGPRLGDRPPSFAGAPGPIDPPTPPSTWWGKARGPPDRGPLPPSGGGGGG